MATQYDNLLIGQIDTGDEQRAKRMQAQYNQPVTGSRGVVQSAGAGVPQSTRQDSAGIERMVTGALSLPVAAVREGIGNIGTDIANVGRMAIGGLPEPRPGYPRTAALAQQARDGAAAFAGANRNLLADTQSALRDATGTQVAASGRTPSIGQDMPAQGQAAAAPAQQAAPASGSQPAQATATPAIASNTPGQGDTPAGNGYTQAGNGIAMRVGAGGVPEFTNDASVVAGAGAMPQGGMARIGDGIGGGLSVGAPGDSQLAIDRFERANQERQRMIDISRRGQIGEGGGRVTIVRDSSRGPSLADIQSSRLDARQAQTNLQNQQAQQGILAGLDDRLTNQLNRQRTQQEIEAGRQSQETQQRIADLRAQIANTSLSVDQRQAAVQAYNALTLSPADRYMTVQGGTNEFGGKDASKVFDRLTGREVGANDSPAMAADLEQARRIIAADPSKRAEVERRLQQAYGRGLDG